ncbi:MAG: hypothetical protein JST36_07505 [Bacteroidetes bacterium]|nr:hypothetical protein [Bacteroidota bacterium]
MTYTAKKNIDALVPLAAACAVGFWYFRKYGTKRWQMLVVIVLATYFALWLATTRITKSILEAAPSSAKLPAELNPSACSNYDPTGDVNAVYSDSTSLFFNSDAPYSKLLSLSDCELVKAYNDWNARYYQTAGGQTLAQVVAGQTSIFNGGFQLTQKTLAQRFTKYNLS